MTFFWQNPVFSGLTGFRREDYEGQVKGPGKFGGEKPYVPYFYDVMAHGAGPDLEDSYPEGGGWVGIFEVDEEDRKLFPELRIGQKIAIYERSDGIVEEVKVKWAREEMEEMSKAQEEFYD